MHLTLVLALNETTPKLGAASSDLGAASPDLGAMTAVIAVFLVCLLATGYGVRRLLGSAWRARAAKRSLSVLDVLPLGGRRQLVVVRCYDRTLALGLGDRDVSLLAELDTELVAAEVARSGENATRAKQQFRGLVDRASRALHRVDLTTSEPARVVAPMPPPRSPATPRIDRAEPPVRALPAPGARRSTPLRSPALPSDVDEVVA
jgi:flagellar biogenesis protein FliO